MMDFGPGPAKSEKNLMTRYWVIAPTKSNPPELFEKVWQFDLSNGLISIGWRELGDVSKMSKDTLSDWTCPHF